MARILFLHGPSSSGKSTLAAAIRAKSATPFLHLSIDHLRDSGAWRPDAYADWPAARPAFFDGFHRMLAGFADAGCDLIVEHILDTLGWNTQLQTLFAPHDVLFVGLAPSFSALTQREAARGNRPIGSAARDAAHVHDGLHYDLTFDGSTPVEDMAQLLLTHLDGPRPRSRFFS